VANAAVTQNGLKVAIIEKIRWGEPALTEVVYHQNY
jgi:hypothetical protein